MRLGPQQQAEVVSSKLVTISLLSVVAARHFRILGFKRKSLILQQLKIESLPSLVNGGIIGPSPAW
jgi:hypothetical protein